MKVTPIKRRSRKRWALLEPGWRCLRVLSPDGDAFAQGERQCHELLQRVEDRTLYVRGALTSMLHTTGATTWQAEVWRGRAVRMSLDGCKAEVISLRGCLPRDGAFEHLSTVLGFLSDYGIGPGAISSMGWNLWRASLAGPVTIDADPDIAGPAVFGGRQEIREPRTYQHMVAADISAAYPHSMSAAPFALTLRRVDPSTEIRGDEPGLARAVVDVPDDLPYAPLPVRIGPEVIQWQKGVVAGIWTWGELAAAIDLGCRVRVEECFAPGRVAHVFAPWWNLVEQVRAFGALGKVISNSTWGSFAMRGDDTSSVRWIDDRGERSVTVHHVPKTLPHARCAHIAAESSSRVRVRLLREGLYRRFAPVHVDTDGIIVRRSAGLPEPSGAGPGEWRAKAEMTRVEVRAPQVYRHKCRRAGCFEWHYVTAGVPPEMSEQVFERVGRLGISVGFGGRDIVLPPQNPLSRASVDALAARALALVAGIYGPGLGDSDEENTDSRSKKVSVS